MTGSAEGHVPIERSFIQAQHLAVSQGALISLSNLVVFALIKPYVHGVIWAEPFPWLVSKDYDWANVSVSTH